MSERDLFLGNLACEPPSRLLLDPSDLTTHGVVVGMTGSGKTGLLVALVEEALGQGQRTSSSGGCNSGCSRIRSGPTG